MHPAKIPNRQTSLRNKGGETGFPYALSNRLVVIPVISSKTFENTACLQSNRDLIASWKHNMALRMYEMGRVRAICPLFVETGRFLVDKLSFFWEGGGRRPATAVGYCSTTVGFPSTTHCQLPPNHQ